MFEVSSHSVEVARIMPIGTPIWGNAPKKPRRFVGACSTAMSAAPPHSPPAEKPCRMRSRISRIGAAMPICAYVGSRPMSEVDRPMSMSVKTSIFLRPSRSPR
ncbi:hypothetical protein QFZ26_002457 [Agromyces ramosus]|uniref:Uncharacterized protein n=1 Tax=Agromyces ramosus TaxID=33879 RepID=A0ABU0R9Z3_9MICO|nr:hypothetical protein [Agromyces ramosus]